MPIDYKELLDRVKDKLQPEGVAKQTRFEVPEPDVIWVGNRTIVRNFGHIADLLRRDPQKMLVFFAREMATAATLDEDKRAIFIGRRDLQSFKVLLQRYIKTYVLCPVCNSPDTRLEKRKRITFLVCEACGAWSPVRG
jgi:translation initiation factor 2 subunit 2